MLRRHPCCISERRFSSLYATFVFLDISSARRSLHYSGLMCRMTYKSNNHSCFARHCSHNLMTLCAKMATLSTDTLSVGKLLYMRRSGPHRRQIVFLKKDVLQMKMHLACRKGNTRKSGLCQRALAIAVLQQTCAFTISDPPPPSNLYSLPFLFY